MKTAMTFAIIIATLIPFSPTSAVSTIETPVIYHLDFNRVSVEEAQAVIERTYGSGAMDQARADYLLGAIADIKEAWAKDHPDAEVIWRIPFYGLRDKPVAYEYLLGCDGWICGSIYDVFPGADTMNQALDTFYKWARCIDAYGCIENIQPTSGSRMVQFLPDAIPVSLRLAARIDHGPIRFFHAIYAVARETKTVISLDPRDANLSVKDMRRRLHGLITPTTQSASIPLVYERARMRDYSPLYDTGTARSPSLDELRAGEKPFQCKPVSVTSRTVYAVDWPGKVHTETLESKLPRAMYYEPWCLGLPWEFLLFVGDYATVNYGSDYLTGRQTNGFYELPTYLENPL